VSHGTEAVGTLLLDLDGTLIDSEELILSSYRHTMRVHRGEEPPDEAWKESMGRPLHDQLREFAEDDAEVREMVRTYREHNREVHDELLRPFPGVRDAVERIRSRGYRLGIVTSKLREPALEGLRVCGYPRDWFEVLVAADDVDRHKPSPEPVRSALRVMGAEPSGALFVGDSVHDLRAGRAAGTGTGAALWGPYRREDLAPGRPDYWLEDVSALERLLA